MSVLSSTVKLIYNAMSINLVAYNSSLLKIEITMNVKLRTNDIL